MSKVIAYGYVRNDEDFQVAATVFEKKAGGEESAASEFEVKLVFKAFNLAELPAAPLSFDDLVAELEEDMVVPGVEGHADVTLEAPVIMHSAKTKSFEYAGRNQVIVSMRYMF